MYRKTSLETIPDESENKEIMNDDKTPLLPYSRVKLFKRRWLMLLIFSLNTMSNGVLFMGLSSISNVSARYYNVSTVLIEWLSNMYMVVYVFTALPAAYVMSRVGIRPIMVVGAALDATATGLHYTGYRNVNFHFVIIGQIFAALAFGMILQVPGQLSATWFPENERGTATAIGVFMNILGVAIGFVQPTHMVKDSLDNSIVEIGLKHLYLSQMIVVIIVLIFTAVFFQNEPPAPPTLLQPTTDDDVKFVDTLKALVKDKNFLLMSQAYGIYYGLYVTFSVLLNSYVTSSFPNGYASTVGWMGFSCDSLAIFSCLFIGLWLDRYHHHKAMAVLLNSCSLITWLAFILILTRAPNIVGLFVTYSALGVVGVPYFSCGIEQAAEMTYPVPEGTSSAVILILGNLYGFIFILVLGVLNQAGHIQLSGFIIAGLYLLSTALSCISKTDLRRCRAAEEAEADRLNKSENDFFKGWVHVHLVNKPIKKVKFLNK